MQIFKNMSIFDFLKIILNRIEKLYKYYCLKNKNFSVNFFHEGDTVIKLPKVAFWQTIIGKWSILKRNSDFASRPTSEVLLRKTIYQMYQSGYICSQLSIIDIGCWIADNSIVWSKFLSNNGKVFAIDPSSENLNFGKMIAKINNIENIKWVQAVCAEREGIRLNFDGSIDHTSFYRATSENYLISKSIDSIIMDTRSPIGLLHVDVEGFELSVLKGSKEVILRDRPVISFEQHISKENLEFISKYLKSYNYRIFMINEVLPGNALDCRNFLALPKEKGLPNLKKFKQSRSRSIDIYSATIGPAIIELE